MTYSKKAPKKKSGLWWKILVGVFIVFLVPMLLLEFGLRWYIKDNITGVLKDDAAAAGVQLREEPEVTLGTSPLLFSLARRTIPELNIAIPSTLQVSYENNDQSRPVVSGNPHVKLHAKDIHTNEDVLMDSLDMDTLIPTEAMLAQAQATVNETREKSSGLEGILKELLRVTDIKTNEAEQTLMFQLGNGIADLVMKPRIVNGGLTMDAEDVRLLGFSLPQGITDALGEQLSKQASEAGRSLGNLEITGVEVHHDGMQVMMHGTKVSMKDLVQSVHDSGKLQSSQPEPQSGKPGATRQT